MAAPSLRHAAGLLLLLAAFLAVACSSSGRGSKTFRPDSQRKGPGPFADPMSLQVGVVERPDGFDVVTAQGVGASRDEAQQAALAAARTEAAAVRRADVRAVSEDAYDSAGLDSFRSFARIDTEAVLVGARPGRWLAEPREDGTWVAVAELIVAHEQLQPGDALADLIEGDDTPRPELLEFVARAENRGDHDAASSAWRTLLAVDPRPEDVVSLAYELQRGGHVPLAVNTLDERLATAEQPDPRWQSARDELAQQLPDPDDIVARLLRAARNDEHGHLQLSVSRTIAHPGDPVTLRGAVPADEDLVMIWIDGEEASALWAGPAGTGDLADGHLSKDYVADGPGDWVAGTVHVVVLSGPGLNALLDSELEVDLVAAERGDLLALERLADTTALLAEWIADPEVEAQVLTWTQEP